MWCASWPLHCWLRKVVVFWCGCVRLNSARLLCVSNTLAAGVVGNGLLEMDCGVVGNGLLGLSTFAAAKHQVVQLGVNQAGGLNMWWAGGGWQHNARAAMTQS
jgi:hypothetical protein